MVGDAGEWYYGMVLYGFYMGVFMLIFNLSSLVAQNSWLQKSSRNVLNTSSKQQLPLHQLPPLSNWLLAHDIDQNIIPICTYIYIYSKSLTPS
jgi:hypothetical protein